MEYRLEMMKNILHFGGGQDAREQSTYKRYLEGYQATAEAPFFGGKIHNFFKNSSAPLQINLSDSATNLINNGASLMTFFGHAYGSNFGYNGTKKSWERSQFDTKEELVNEIDVKYNLELAALQQFKVIHFSTAKQH